MFRKHLLGGSSLSRIVDGEYLSPNICFIDEDKETSDHGDTENEADDENEGPEESDETENEDGDESEVESDGDGDEEGAEDDQGGTARQVDEKPKRKGASEVIRENKRARQESDRKADEALRRAEAAERRAEAAERTANERRATESKEAREARLAVMSPEERFEVLRQEDREAHTQELNSVKFQIWDSTDKAEFRQLVREDPLVAKVQEKVEAKYAELQRSGRPVSREILADIEVGKMMRASQKSAGTKQRRKAEEGVRRETVKSKQVTRSESAPNRARRGQENTREARAKRLEGVLI